MKYSSPAEYVSHVIEMTVITVPDHTSPRVGLSKQPTRELHSDWGDCRDCGDSGDSDWGDPRDCGDAGDCGDSWTVVIPGLW